MTWQELCEDRRFANLPFKIELSRTGKIIMSPTRNKHGYYAGEISHLLRQRLPHGHVLVECAIDTPEGTVVADTTWVSAERFKIIREQFSCSIAPEICVEVWSPSNTREELAMKRQPYLGKGAVEVWFCDDQGGLTFFSARGELDQSELCPAFPKKIPS